MIDLSFHRIIQGRNRPRLLFATRSGNCIMTVQLIVRVFFRYTIIFTSIKNYTSSIVFTYWCFNIWGKNWLISNKIHKKNWKKDFFVKCDLCSCSPFVLINSFCYSLFVLLLLSLLLSLLSFIRITTNITFFRSLLILWKIASQFTWLFGFSQL